MKTQLPKIALALALLTIIFLTLLDMPVSADGPLALQDVINNPLDLQPGIKTDKNPSPAFVDIDGDGDLDFFVGADNGRVLYHQNIGTAQRPLFQRTDNINPLAFVNLTFVIDTAPAFADIDDDGDLDAFIGASNGFVHFYENVGDAGAPTFAERQGAENPFDGLSIGINLTPTFADIDGDGDLDAFIGEFEGNINYYLNIGSANSPRFFSQTGANNPLESVDVGTDSTPLLVDLNGDGDLDALIGSAAGNVAYFENIGTAQAAILIQRTGEDNPLEIDLKGSYNGNHPATADIDSDGDLDFFFGRWTALVSFGHIAFFENIGTAQAPQFTQRQGPSNPLGGARGSVPSFVDLDGDNDADAVIGSSLGELYYFPNIGAAETPRFDHRYGANSPVDGLDIGSNSHPVWVDIEADGDVDLFVGAEDGLIYFYENTGTAQTSILTASVGGNNPFDGLDVGADSAPAFVDIDADGDWDVFFGSENGTLHFYENIGSPQSPLFAQRSDARNPFNGQDLGQKIAPAFLDFDMDGDFDLFVGDSSGYTSYFENGGTAQVPVFTERTDEDNPLNGVDVGTDSAPAFVDIEADGDADLFIGAGDGLLSYFYQSTSQPSLQLTKTVTPSQVAPGQVVTYTLKVHNSGSELASGVVITDRLPTGVAFGGFLSADDVNEAIERDGLITWFPLTVATNISRTLGFTATAALDPAPAGQPITNRASLRADNSQPSSSEATFLLLSDSTGDMVTLDSAGGDYDLPLTAGITLTLSIPANAITGTVDLHFQSLSTPSQSPPAGWRQAGPGFILEARRDQNVQNNFVFLQPITFRLPYSPTLQGPGNMPPPPETLRLFKLKDQQWRDVLELCAIAFPAHQLSYQFDPSQNLLSAPLCGLSEFVLLGEEQSSDYRVYLPLIEK